VSAHRTWVAFVLTGREVLRGRLVLLLVAVVPTVFFLLARLTGSEADVAFELAFLADGAPRVVARQQDEAAVFIGLSAAGLLTSFFGLRLLQREADATARLLLCGYRAAEILAARLAVLALVVVGVALWVGAAIPLVFFAVDRPAALLGAFVAGGFVYGAYGLLVGALLRRELEGILFVSLLTNLDSGWLQNPLWYADARHRALIEALPGHLPAQAAMGAAFTDEPVAALLAGSALYGAALLGAALAVFSWRHRRR
jgi:ABC-2 type transport system permease protein